MSHWLATGEAVTADLLEARERTKMAHALHGRVVRKYARLSGSSVMVVRQLA